MDPAEGGITISNNEFTTVLNYLSVGDLFDFRQRDRNANALQHAQDYVDSAAVLQGQSAFDLQLEFELTYSDTDPSVVMGGLGGDDAAPVAASVVAEARPQRVILPADLHVHEPPLRPARTSAT